MVNDQLFHIEQVQEEFIFNSNTELFKNRIYKFDFDHNNSETSDTLVAVNNIIYWFYSEDSYFYYFNMSS